jgi:uncharacterized protein (TIGR02246 family)
MKQSDHTVYHNQAVATTATFLALFPGRFRMTTELARLEVIHAIETLMAAYCEACDDNHNGQRVAQLFSEDGVWEYLGRPAACGHRAIKAHIDQIRDSGTIGTSAHLLHNAQIEVDGDTASGQWRFTMLCNNPEKTQFHQIIGRYKNRFTRENGRWRIRHLLAEVDLRQVTPAGD